MEKQTILRRQSCVLHLYVMEKQTTPSELCATYICHFLVQFVNIQSIDMIFIFTAITTTSNRELFLLFHNVCMCRYNMPWIIKQRLSPITGYIYNKPTLSENRKANLWHWVQINFICIDNLRILFLSCNAKQSKTTAKWSENSWSTPQFNCFQWCHLYPQRLYCYRFFLSFNINQVPEMIY